MGQKAVIRIVAYPAENPPGQVIRHGAGSCNG